jgi:flavin-dependent dehydrogenase
MRSRPFDVVVIGGGPGGSICSAQLARKGLSVIVFEKTAFPRFHLGESLLPQSLVVLDELGVLDAVDATFMRKYGARFHDDVNGKKDRFSFDGAWKPDFDHAFEVPRDAFDKLLLDHAAASGAIVRERWTVKEITRDGPDGQANGVDVVSPEGVTETVEARFVVDASGRDALTAHASSGTTKIEGLDQTALYAHFEGIPRQAGKLEGDIDIVLFPSGDAQRPNWFWFIPFKDGRTSVGAVVSRAWMRDRRRSLPRDARKLSSALFDLAVSESKTASELLAKARCVWPEKEATADFSYRVRSMNGPGWIRIGDAGGFIDPLFSTGAHLAMCGGKLGADAIVEALASPADERRIMEAWEARVREAAETFILAVRAFYSGPLVGLLFAEDKHVALRRSITSLLAGDVFGESIWLRDTRNRLREMLAVPAASSTTDA